MHKSYKRNAAYADDIANVLTENKRAAAEQLLRGILADIPAAWLGDELSLGSVEQHRAAYLAFFQERLKAPRAFAEEAVHARDRLL